MSEHPIQGLMDVTLQRIKDMVDSNTIIGAVSYTHLCSGRAGRCGRDLLGGNDGDQDLCQAQPGFPQQPARHTGQCAEHVLQRADAAGKPCCRGPLPALWHRRRDNGPGAFLWVLRAHLLRALSPKSEMARARTFLKWLSAVGTYSV